MRRLAVCLVLMLCWGGSPARAGDVVVSGADRKAIEEIIASQLDAFRHDAGDAAFGLASPNIQAMFGDAANFMAMVRQGYPPVYRPRSFAFEQLVTTDDRVVQRVTIVGPDGGAVLALYTMEREADGTWRIDGCTLTRPSGLDT